MTQVTLLESRFEPAVASFDEAREREVALDLEEALEIDWPGDFHFTTYWLQNGTKTFHTRIKKKRGRRKFDQQVSLGVNDFRAAGFEALTSYFVGDLDRPGHEAWSSAAEAKAFLAEAVEACFLCQRPVTAAYTTRAGIRLIWRLADPVVVEEAERRQASLFLELLCEQGLRLDSGCLDWTRLMRLPRVERDGRPQGEQEWFELYRDPETDLDASTLPEANLKAARTELSQVPDLEERLRARLIAQARQQSVDLGDPPPIDEAWGEAWLEDTVPTVLGKAILAKTAHAHERTLRYGQPLREGRRDDSLTRLTGALCRGASQVREATPSCVFGLLIPRVSELEPDDGTDDWYVKAWSLIERFWEETDDPEVDEEREEYEQQLVETEEKREATKPLMQQQAEFYERVRLNNPQFCDGLDDEQMVHFCADHAIVGRKPTECYRLMPDGTYFPFPERWSKCVQDIVEHPLYSEVRPWFVYEGNGNVERVKWESRFFDKDGYKGHLHDVIYSARRSRGLWREPTGATVLNLKIHEVRRDVEPRFHPQVDLWLEEFFDQETEAGRQYLAYFSYADRPICALILHGAARSGKSLLAAAMANLFDSQGPVRDPGTSRFNADTLRNPVWFYDEALPGKAGEVKRFDAYLRERVTGGFMPVERKGVDTYSAEMFPRFVFASNNDSLLSAVFGHRDLTHEDQEALAERLLIVRVGDRARNAIDRAKAHFGTEPALLKAVTEHLMLLREEADLSTIPAENRFMVRGSVKGSNYIQSAAVRSDHTIFLAEAILKVAEQASVQGTLTVEGLCSGRLQFTTKRLRKAIELMPQAKSLKDENITRQVADLLERLDITFDRARNLRMQVGDGARLRGFSISLMDLYRTCMPVRDIELNISETADAHLTDIIGAPWLALKHQHGYDS